MYIDIKIQTRQKCSQQTLVDYDDENIELLTLLRTNHGRVSKTILPESQKVDVSPKKDVTLVFGIYRD